MYNIQYILKIISQKLFLRVLRLKKKNTINTVADRTPFRFIFSNGFIIV